MKLSTRSIYGLRMLYHLAVHHDTGQPGPLQLSEIVQRENISEKYLGQIVLLLRSGGLLVSVRGNQGGYRLAAAPGAITVLQVVECLEGDFLGFPDGIDPDDESTDSLRATNEVWRRMRDAVVETLEGLTLEDLVRIPQVLNLVLNYSI